MTTWARTWARRTLIALGTAGLVLAAVPADASTPGTVSGRFRAGGVRQFIDCRGPLRPTAHAGPTVVLVSGLGAGTNYWGKVLGPLRADMRVCVYDRPGIERSPRRAAHRVVDAGVHADELAALLTKVGETRPLVLVGHSYGGLLVRAFAVAHPERVSAMMLLDASYASQWQDGGRYWPEPDADIDMAATEGIVSGLPQLGSKPLVVETAGIGSSSNWIRRQVRMATLSTNVEHVIVPGSSHVIQQIRPAAVVRAVFTTWSAARTGRHLPVCRSVAAYWVHVGARCV